MRFTKSMKETFIQNLMADVVQINYTEPLEKLLKAEAISQLPYALKSVVQADKTMLPYIATDYTGYPFRVHVPNREYIITPTTKAKAEVILAQRDEQQESRRTIKQQMEGLLEAFTTVAQLEKAMPDLVQYLPVTSDPLKNLPISNALAALMTAGWKPKKST